MSDDAAFLLEGFLSLGTPEGFRAELVEGEIVVTPTPEGGHEHCISRIVRQMYRRSRTGMTWSGNKGLTLKEAPGRPRDHVIPDGTFAPEADRLLQGAEPWMPCEGVAMAMEVTGGRPNLDRETKRRCYARGRIPLYLLVDRGTSRVTLFGDPEGGDYREAHMVSFGKSLPLPDPFGFDLETAHFV